MDLIETRVLPVPTTSRVLMRLRLIGQMEAWTSSSENILPTGRKTRGLLAIVALSAPRPVLRGKLAEMLWSRRPEEQARASLRQEIHRLLDALDPLGSQVLTITRDHLALRPGTVWVDVEEVLRASTSKPATLSLVDGELLEGLDGIDAVFDNWLASERERLNDRARTLADAMLRDQTEPGPIISAAQQLLRIDRTHEGAWRAMMRAYLATGERGMALQAYERCRSVLADQLDAQPSPDTQRLAAEIRRESPAARPSVPEAATSGPHMARPVARAPLRPLPRQAVRPASGETGATESVSSRATVPFERLWPDTTEVEQELPEQTCQSVMPRGGPKVGVLPLQAIGMPESEAHLAIAIADTLTTDLSRFRWLSVASSSALARFATETRDESAIRTAFGLDFLLDGIAQRDGSRLRVSFRVLDLRGATQVVLTDRLEGEANNLLTLQDEISASIVARTEPAILMAEAQRVTARPMRTSNAYDRLMRGIAAMERLERPMLVMAGEHLQEAISLSPDSAAAHSWSAWWMTIMLAQGWTGDDRNGAVELAERAVMLDQQDARALAIAGHVRAVVQRRPQESLTLHERALVLNPSLGMAWALAGAASAYLGRVDEAAWRTAHYKQLSPHDPQAFALDCARVLVALLKRDHATAVEIGREIESTSGGFSISQKYHLAALGHAGHRQEAEGVRRRLLSTWPNFSISGFLASTPLAREEDRNHVAEGLRLAGIFD